MIERLWAWAWGPPRPKSLKTTKHGKRGRTERYIRQCPWPEDITIDRTSWVIDGEIHHSVTCDADGPNGDGSFHHGWIGYWSDFKSFEEANDFVVVLWSKIRELTEVSAPVYVSGAEKNAHAGWCMGEGGERPPGRRPIGLPTTFDEYD